MIYFARMGEDGPIKIGHTTQKVAYRMVGLEYEYGLKFHLIATMAGDRKDEKALHRRFAKHRCFLIADQAYRRELFHPNPEVVSFIEEVKRAG